jgi:hypothetical protein
MTQESLASLFTAAFDSFQASLVKQLPNLIKTASSHNHLPSSSPIQSSPFVDDAAHDPPVSEGRVGDLQVADLDPVLVPHSDITPYSPGGEVLVPSTSDAPSPITFTSSLPFEDSRETSGISHLTSEPSTNDDKAGRFLIPSFCAQDMSLLRDDEVVQLDDRGLTAMARQGICKSLDDSTAVETCPQQLQAIKLVLQGQVDFSLVIRTGGGKSLAWQVYAILRPKSACVVVVPYVSVLEQHLESCQRKGIVSAKYTTGSDPPKDFQILFIQPETGASRTFSM